MNNPRKPLDNPFNCDVNWRNKKQTEKDAMFQMIDNVTKSIVGSPNRLLEFLDALCRLSYYSINNVIAVFGQNPKASKLKSFEEWAGENHYVRKGEKGISVFEPVTYIKEDGSTGTAFRLAKMFDISQTSRRASLPVQKEQFEIKAVIASMIDNAPFHVQLVDNIPEYLDNMGALYDNMKQTVYIKRCIGNAADLFQGAVLEMAHAELAGISNDVYERKTMGFCAVCAAYMLCRKYGVDASCFELNEAPEEWREEEPAEIRAKKLNRIREVFNNIVGYASKSKKADK